MRPYQTVRLLYCLTPEELDFVELCAVSMEVEVMQPVLLDLLVLGSAPEHDLHGLLLYHLVLMLQHQRPLHETIDFDVWREMLDPFRCLVSFLQPHPIAVDCTVH